MDFVNDNGWNLVVEVHLVQQPAYYSVFLEQMVYSGINRHEIQGNRFNST